MEKIKKRYLRDYMTLVPADKATGSEISLWGDLFEVPTSGKTDILCDGSTQFKYDFSKGEVILVDMLGNDVYKKAVPINVFALRPYSWLNHMKREARLVLNLDEEADDNSLNEAQMAKSSYPEVGKVYWNKKHDTAYSVVAIYPDQTENKQVSYWNDEGTRLTCSIKWFEANMIPSKDPDDYDIFEECEDELNEEDYRSLSKEVEKCLPNGVTLKYIDDDDDDGRREFYAIMKGKDDIGHLTIDYIFYTDGLEISIAKDYKTKPILSIECGVPSGDEEELIKSAIPDIRKAKSKIQGAISKLNGVNEESLDETAGLTVDKKATNAKAFTVEINGKKYSYYPTEESGLTAKELGAKYTAIAKYSTGKALAWLKKNATTKDSYRKAATSSDITIESIVKELKKIAGSVKVGSTSSGAYAYCADFDMTPGLTVSVDEKNGEFVISADRYQEGESKEYKIKKISDVKKLAMTVAKEAEEEYDEIYG